MTDQITADEYRIAAKVLRGNWNQPGFPYSARSAVDHCEGEADRLDREASRDAEAEELARTWWEAYRVAFGAGSAAEGILEWDNLQGDKGDKIRAGHTGAARRTLDSLADRLAPAGGMVLTADEVADVRRIMQGFGGQAAEAAYDRLRARLTPSQVHNHDLDPGCRERRVDGELIGECMAEKPAPRSWPSLNLVPPSVEAVTDQRGITWRWHSGGGVVRGYWCYCVGACAGTEESKGRGPFAEVSA